MNEFETLIACRNHWQWMVITGSKYKSSYAPSDEWPYSCACCDYAGATFDDKGKPDCDNRNCDDCPLLDYAWCYNENDNLAPCEDNGPFSSWLSYKHIPKYRYKYAQQMVDECNRAIEDYLIKR